MSGRDRYEKLTLKMAERVFGLRSVLGCSECDETSASMWICCTYACRTGGGSGGKSFHSRGRLKSACPSTWRFSTMAVAAAAAVVVVVVLEIS